MLTAKLIDFIHDKYRTVFGCVFSRCLQRKEIFCRWFEWLLSSTSLHEAWHDFFFPFLSELNLLHASKLTNMQCVNILFCCLTSLHPFSFLNFLILLLSANSPRLKGAWSQPATEATGRSEEGRYHVWICGGLIQAGILRMVHTCGWGRPSQSHCSRSMALTHPLEITRYVIFDTYHMVDMSCSSGVCLWLVASLWESRKRYRIYSFNLNYCGEICMFRMYVYMAALSNMARIQWMRRKYTVIYFFIVYLAMNPFYLAAILWDSKENLGSSASCQCFR